MNCTIMHKEKQLLDNQDIFIAQCSWKGVTASLNQDGSYSMSLREMLIDIRVTDTVFPQALQLKYSCMGYLSAHQAHVR